MDIKKLLKEFEDLKESHTSVLENVAAIHGDEVAECLDNVALHGRALLTVVQLMAVVGVPKEVSYMMTEPIHKSTMNLAAIILEEHIDGEEDLKAIGKILSGMMDRQADMMVRRYEWNQND